jgi:hypothetical protein
LGLLGIAVPFLLQSLASLSDHLVEANEGWAALLLGQHVGGFYDMIDYIVEHMAYFSFGGVLLSSAVIVFVAIDVIRTYRNRKIAENPEKHSYHDASIREVPIRIETLNIYNYPSAPTAEGKSELEKPVDKKD